MKTTRPKGAKGNAKTALCRAFAESGECKFGADCTFAHGESELRSKKRKMDHPCWWFNNTGCSKSADECAYRHETIADLRKPLHLQHPCIWMHVKTPGSCPNKGCGGDHDYELTQTEWQHHYPSYAYKGTGYLTIDKADVKTDKFNMDDAEFPALRADYLKMEFPSMNPHVAEFIPQRFLNPDAPVFVPFAQRV